MKNIFEIMKEYGLEVPEDKKKDFEKAVLENYKTMTDYDNQAKKLDAANETIKANDTAMKDLQDNDIVMDWDIDQWRIYAAFRSQYHIDLNKEPLHWFVFMGLLANLEECSFTRVIDIRQKQITSKMSQEEKKELRKRKKIFEIKAPEEKITPEEQDRIDAFMKYANINKKEK